MPIELQFGSSRKLYVGVEDKLAQLYLTAPELDSIPDGNPRRAELYAELVDLFDVPRPRFHVINSTPVRPTEVSIYDVDAACAAMQAYGLFTPFDFGAAVPVRDNTFFRRFLQGLTSLAGTAYIQTPDIERLYGVVALTLLVGQGTELPHTDGDLRGYGYALFKTLNDPSFRETFLKCCGLAHAADADLYLGTIAPGDNAEISGPQVVNTTATPWGCNIDRSTGWAVTAVTDGDRIVVDWRGR